MSDKDARRSLVVIVEDDLSLSGMARDLVEECGLEAYECASGQAAHECISARADDIRALFADIDLGDSIDGVALALTTAEKYPWVSICITSGLWTTRPEVLPQKARFLLKPWRAAEVLAFLEAA